MLFVVNYVMGVWAGGLKSMDSRVRGNDGSGGFPGVAGNDGFQAGRTGWRHRRPTLRHPRRDRGSMQSWIPVEACPRPDRGRE